MRGRAQTIMRRHDLVDHQMHPSACQARRPNDLQEQCVHRI